ncbi:hypothetical protein [Streptococcus agalactiae]|nr:hypothetical protein [Streptococcus agalactiae]
MATIWLPFGSLLAPKWLPNNVAIWYPFLILGIHMVAIFDFV